MKAVAPGPHGLNNVGPLRAHCLGGGLADHGHGAPCRNATGEEQEWDVDEGPGGRLESDVRIFDCVGLAPSALCGSRVPLHSLSTSSGAWKPQRAEQTRGHLLLLDPCPTVDVEELK